MMEDPLSPPEPRDDAVFEPIRNAWVLSRYADVVAAFRETGLWPAGPQRDSSSKVPDYDVQQRLRTEIQATFSTSKLAEWRARMAPLASRLAGRLNGDLPVDLLREFAQPWCLAAAEIVTGSNPTQQDLLFKHACIISASAAEPLNAELQSLASTAGKELDQMLATATIPMAGPTFVGLSRTLVCLLSNGWLALLRQPEQLSDLGAHPDLIPRAVDELLRFACIPQMMFRRASEDLKLNGLRIASGERVILMLASANRDPAQFVHPQRLDWSVNARAHVSLGHGPHSCVGGPLIRMAMAVATHAFVNRFAGSELWGQIEWQGGSGFRSPLSLHVVNRRR